MSCAAVALVVPDATAWEIVVDDEGAKVAVITVALVVMAVVAAGVNSAVVSVVMPVLVTVAVVTEVSVDVYKVVL